MALMVVGVNFQTATIDIRERVALDLQTGVEIAHWLIAEGVAREVLIISTCHRTEIYCEGLTHADLFGMIIGRLGLSIETIEPFSYKHLDLAAVMHLMRVATGLDSMIVGESEILGQLKKAYTAFANASTIGKYLGRLFQTTFAIAKDVRTQTGIGVNPVSVAYVAARLAQHIFPDLAKASVLLVGAGDLIRLIAQHLIAMGVQKIGVANRTEANAARLALLFNAEYFCLEKMKEHLFEADIVITGCASALPIISEKKVASALSQRESKPMFIIDLGVPRNVECEVGALDNVHLYCIDDLQKMVEKNKRFRHDAAESAEIMIQIAAVRFMDWLQAQDSFKTLCIFRQKFEQIRDRLCQDALQRLHLGEAPDRVVKRLASDLTSRFLHEPTRRLREAGLDREEALLTLTRDLFELNCETFYTK
ncbi:MAG TPA: glutamyl-tRNA reductase [Gammaproteobacteria bacterium]|nr:glutamyl-tRNA reductase [Gammaproteobacteria bacterium]HQZ87539.1 glutamyl-tRNA reductase [Gammaproteobacteria bacterium]HRA42488.1 glutamyl-tRNA reductase [Gammaproteobacteria bacterium]